MTSTKDKEGSLSKQTRLDGHIIESIIQPINQTQKADSKKEVFTTEPKRKRRTTINISRKGSIVKERCRQLTDIALELFPSRRISYEDLKFLIIKYVGGNRFTVRDYMGYQGRIRISRSSGEGYIVGQPRRGYLETFGFIHRIDHNTWIIHAQKKLFPPHISPFPNNNECVVSKEKISISQRDRTDTV